MSGIRFGSLKQLRKAVAATAAVGAFALLAVPAASADVSIDSSGPLDHIYLNSDLSCQATHTGDTHGEFYGADACGTFLAFNGATYGPNVDAGNSRTEFNQISQSGVTGSGTTADPYKVVTVVDIEQTDETPPDDGPVVSAVGDPENALVTIRQTDSYVIGDEFYRSDINVSNSVDGTLTASLYHAGDCFLQDSDDGFGWFNPTDSGAYCTANPGNSPFGRIEGFIPVTTGNHYYEAHYGTVWSAINNAGDQFPDTVDTNGNGGSVEDNGAGLSWPVSIPVDGNQTYSLLTRFSPTGGAPPTVAQNPYQQAAKSCALRISRARVFLFSRHPRLRLVARYRTDHPADVNIDFTAVKGKNKDPLGTVTRHFTKHGLFRLRKQLTDNEAEQLRDTDKFVVNFEIPGEPGFCSRKYRKKLTVPRIIDGQRVVFQSDSKFGPGSPGHPENG
jgi:hypothetical protein